MEEKDFLDNKIWVENRIEELKQEVKDIVDKKIDNLNYSEVTRNFDKRNKRIRKEFKAI